MKELKFQCCFCGEGIAETSTDPCAVILVANWRSPQSEQAEQQYFCHLACFKKTCPDVPVEVEELLADKRH